MFVPSGFPVTEALIYDITMTAATLLEAVEPSILWKHLLKGIINAIKSSESQLEVCQRGVFTFCH